MLRIHLFVQPCPAFMLQRDIRDTLVQGESLCVVLRCLQNVLCILNVKGKHCLWIFICNNGTNIEKKCCSAAVLVSSSASSYKTLSTLWINNWTIERSKGLYCNLALKPFSISLLLRVILLRRVLCTLQAHMTNSIRPRVSTKIESFKWTKSNWR